MGITSIISTIKRSLVRVASHVLTFVPWQWTIAINIALTEPRCIDQRSFPEWVVCTAYALFVACLVCWSSFLCYRYWPPGAISRLIIQTICCWMSGHDGRQPFSPKSLKAPWYSFDISFSFVRRRRRCCLLLLLIWLWLSSWLWLPQLWVCYVSKWFIQMIHPALYPDL